MQKQEESISKEPAESVIICSEKDLFSTKATNESISIPDSTSSQSVTEKTIESTPIITTTTTNDRKSNESTTTEVVASLNTPSAAVIHRHNNANRLDNRIRPQSVVSARALVFDEKALSDDLAGAIPKAKSIKSYRTEQISVSDPKFLSPSDSVRAAFAESLKQSGYVNIPSPLSSTPGTNYLRKESFTPGSNFNSGSGSLFKSASATSVAKDHSDSLPPMTHQRKISYQPRTFRPNGNSTSKSINEISNLVRVRNSTLGKSAPTLSTVIYFFYTKDISLKVRHPALK